MAGIVDALECPCGRNQRVSRCEASVDSEALTEAGFNHFFNLANYTVTREERDLSCSFICQVSLQM